MATKPSVRIPEWATSHTPQPTGSNPAIYPVIEPSPAMISAGWTPPPASPPYEVMNALQHDAGKWLKWFDQLFASNGAFTAGGAHGRLDLIQDDAAVHWFDHLPTAAAICLIRSGQVHARGEMRIGVQTGGAAEGCVLEQISGLPLARSLQIRGQSGVATGMSSGAMGIAFNDSPNSDFLALHPRTSSLYKRNLIKAQATCTFEFSALGAISVVGIEATSFNVPSGSLNTGTTPQQFELLLQEDFSPACLVATIVDASITSPQFSCALVRIPGTPDKIAVRLYWSQAGSWRDAFTTDATLANVTVKVSVLAI